MLKAVEILGVAPPLESIGYVAVTDVTPEVVVVAITFPKGSTAIKVPAGVPSDGSQKVPAVKKVEEAFTKVCS